MNHPHIIIADNFQKGWADAVIYLKSCGWDAWNLIVQIENSIKIKQTVDDKVTDFAKELRIKTPRQVVYTIFPYQQYKKGNRDSLYANYNTFHRRTKTAWGTYFYRMIRYERDGRTHNQLENIIKAIKSRRNTTRAGYTIIIQYPGGESIRPLGGPCLNYLAVQVEPGDKRKIGLLAVYRNHEFIERAYGNYRGLCLLINYIAHETNSDPGTLTCVSSHAYVKSNKVKFKCFIDSIYNEIP